MLSSAQVIRSHGMAKTHDHEMVSIYPFSDAEIEQLMNNSNECVLMWATKDGWPVGVIHAFVWHDGKIWMTFAAHRHRAAAIRRDNRVSVCVSSGGYPPRADAALPRGAITFKGRAALFDDETTKQWFYPALSKKLNPNNEAGEEFFNALLDSPLRVILAVTPEKKIMYNAALAGRHMAGTVSEAELGARLESDRIRMNKERAARGLKPR
jgi:general stress protein 26